MKTFRGWPGVRKGSKEATSLQEKHQGPTDILQKIQGLVAEDWGKVMLNFSDVKFQAQMLRFQNDLEHS